MPRESLAFAHPKEREIAKLAILVGLGVLISLPVSLQAAGGGSATANSGAPIAVFGNTTATNVSSTSLNDSAATWNFAPSAPAGLPTVSLVGAWPTFEQNQQRTGKNAFENTISVSNASQLTRVWVHGLTAGVYGSPAVVNGTVYLGDYSGNESALYATNGSSLHGWPVRMAGSSGNFSFTGCFGGQNNVRGITASATVWENTVFVPADNNYLYALNATTGVVLPGWPVDLSNVSSNDSWKSYYPWGSPLVYDGYVYIGVASGCDAPLVQGKLLQINITSHPTVVHHVDLAYGKASGGGVWSTPSLEAGTNTVWVTTGNCPSTSCTGSTQNWTQAIVALSGSNVCQPRSGGCTSKGYYHLTTGNDVDFGAGATVYTLPWNGTTMVVATDKNGYAYAFYADTLKANGGSTPAWKLQTSSSGCNCGKNIAPAAFDGNSIYLGSSATTLSNGTSCTGGSVRSVNLTTGAVKWESCALGIVRAGLTYANGIVVDAADWTNNYGATVEVRNANTGAVLDSILANQTVNGEPIISNGRLFFGTGNWTLCGNASTDPYCPPGYVDAYGIPIGPYNSSMKPIYGGLAAPGYCGGVYSWGNVSGGMATYNFTWAWGGSYYSYTRDSMRIFCAGHYYPSLTITDAAGEVASRMWSVTVYTYTCSNQTFPFCSITSALQCIVFGALNCYTGPVVEPVTLGAWITWSLTGVTWNWNFGDGTAHSTALSPTHTYASHGTYTVTVTVTNSEHVQYQQSFQVTV